MLDYRAYSTRAAKLVEVIEVVRLTGEGTSESVARELIEYWSKEGELLATKDTYIGVISEC